MTALSRALALPGFWRLEKHNDIWQAGAETEQQPRWGGGKAVVWGKGTTPEQACANLLALLARKAARP